MCLKKIRITGGVRCEESEVGKTALVNLLINNGANIHMPIPSMYGYMTGMLHIACDQHNSPNILQLLIDKGINPNDRNENDQTPLHCAAGIKNTEMMTLLLENGADVNVCDINGDTPFTYQMGGFGGVAFCAQSDSYLLHIENCLHLLLQHGANIIKIGRNGATCLFLAVNGLCDTKLGVHTKLDFIKKLINAGADVNICMEQNRRHYIECDNCDNDCYVSGDTPLHAAVKTFPIYHHRYCHYNHDKHHH